MARNPDPGLELATIAGVSRTLDDWSTMFHLCLVILPDRPEADQWIPVAKRIFDVLGDSNARCAYVVTGGPLIAGRILAGEETRVLTFVDPDSLLPKSLGLTHLPAFVHLRQDTSVGEVAQGWDPVAWQQVASSVGEMMAWSVPDITPPGSSSPAPTAGWEIL
ncbi:MAG: hypothetical protein EXQ69_09210 [Acidimicrobiia bacterium]|nr:hypothetical protein [Acidimicrobiia bacterium]